MKLSLSKIAVILLVFLTTTAYAQYRGFSYNFYGGGARSEGMGQAFLAVSDDGSAGSWNPAGLYVHEKTLMQFSYGVLMPRGNEKYFLGSESPDPAVIGPAYTKKDHQGEYPGIDYMAIISPLRIKGHHVVASMSFTQHFDTYNTFLENLLYDHLGWGPYPNAKIETHGSINSVNFAFGTRVYKQLSMGVSANIYYGKVVSEEYRYLRASVVDIDNITRVYRNGIRVIDSTDFTGFNATIGFLYAAEPIRAGLAVRLPFDLKGNTDSTIVSHATEGGVGGLSIPIQSTPYFSMFKSDTVYIDDMTSRYQMPFIVGFGVAYDISENWILAGDVEYRGFKGKKVKILDRLELTAGGERVEYFTDNDLNWSNVFQFRVGTEYRWETPVGIIPFRVGFRNEAFPDGNVSNIATIFEGEKGSSENDSTRVFYVFDSNDDNITGFSMAVGIGIHWSQIQIDLAYTNTRYSQELYKGDYLQLENKWNDHRLNVSFTGYF
jgi:opacity protein-like surface antigen